MFTTINKQTEHTTRFLSLRMRRKTRLRYGFRTPVSASEVDPAVGGSFFVDVLLFFDGSFWVKGSSVCGTAGGIWGGELVAARCLTTDRGRRLAVEVVVVTCVACMVGASTSVMVTTELKEMDSKGKERERGRRGMRVRKGKKA
jgi:hypothetical protein